jgi:hypothetical protein
MAQHAPKEAPARERRMRFGFVHAV